MRNKFILFSIVFLLAVASFYFISCGNAGSSGQSSKVEYNCPMHPDFISDKAGDCPICNMRLVKIDKAEPAKKEEPAIKTSNAVTERQPEEICLLHKCNMKNCGMNVKVRLKPGERVSCPICGEYITTESGTLVRIDSSEEKTPSTKKERKLLFYRNPMDPTVTSPVAIKDPMGMDYIPVYDEEAKSTGVSVQISQEKQQLIGVTTAAVVKKILTKSILASGKIAYDPNLVIAQEEFIQAVKTLDNVKDSPLSDVIERAKALTNASRQKLKLLGMSEEQIRELEINLL
ncbi:MAG: efflux RND transporter periplasmic adaptor subunit, partial [Candidatus Omnitrophica bacterium]|nr:efflux RND transporter periplasmic adaptor subunit [Candidatus Omnitrophota bacterium]